jgi:O-antigen/teichoic acid export membrane protein
MPSSVYAHVPEHMHDRKLTVDFLWTNILVLTILSVGSLLILWLFSQSIDRYFFKTGASFYVYGLALIGTQMYIWLNFVRDTLNASGKFLHINIATNISNLIKAALLIYITLQGNLTVEHVLIILGIVGPLIVFIYIFGQSRWIFRAITQAQASYQHVKLRFTLTYFVSTQLFQLATRADLFMIAYFLTRPEVGYYGLSQRVILAVVTSADSITQVMSPQFAKIKTQHDVKKLLKQSAFYMLIPTGMFLMGAFLPSSIYILVFGKTYEASTLITKLLSFAYIPFPFLAALLLFFLYTVKKPHYLLISNGLFFLTIMIVHTLLIPHLRLVAPPISYFTAFIVVTCAMFTMYRHELKQLPKS